MRITSKGQVTIPKEFRDKFGLQPDSEVAFRISRGKLILEKATTGDSRGKKLVRHMRGRAGKGMTTDEIMALTRGE